MIKKIAGSVLGRVKQRLRLYALKGDNYECPICEKSFITFLPFGQKKRLRPNALCPNCKSKERTRLYWRYLTQKDGFLTTKKRVFHVAPESMLFEKFMANDNFDYHPVDKFMGGYKYPAGTKNMDILDIQYPDNHFDFILCSHVLEHIPEDIKAMKEMYRVLKPGGFGILQVPMETHRAETYEDWNITTPEGRLKAFHQSDHVRIYGLDYADRLESAGFEVKLDNYANDIPPAEKRRFGLADEKLYVVSKPASAS